MIRRLETQHSRRSAFTLMEMLIVVAIIVALAGIGGFFLMGQLAGAQKDTAQTQVKALSQVCDAYKIKHNKFPETLDLLLQRDESGQIWMDDPNRIIDPWGRPYQYNASGTNNMGLHADIWTDAPDGTGQIGNWPRQRK